MLLCCEIVWTQQGFQIFDTILWWALTLIAVINCTVSKLIRTKTSRIIAINQTGIPNPLNLNNNFEISMKFSSSIYTCKISVLSQICSTMRLWMLCDFFSDIFNDCIKGCGLKLSKETFSMKFTTSLDRTDTLTSISKIWIIFVQINKVKFIFPKSGTIFQFG